MAIEALAVPKRIWHEHKKPVILVSLTVATIAIASFFISKKFMKTMQILGQAYNPDGSKTPWGRLILGFGSDSIGLSGCILTALTMAFNYFNPSSTPLTPDTANDLLKQANAFVANSSSMYVDRGAAAIGMILQDIVSFDGKGTPSADAINAMTSFIDKTLSSGGLILLRVDHNRDIGLKGDHTIVIYDRTPTGYIAADPALARMIDIDRNLQGSAGMDYGTHLPYQGVSVSSLFNS